MPIPLSTLLQSGITLDPPRRTSQTTYYHPIVHRNPQNGSLSPIVCQTPWLWLPSAPRYVTRHHRRIHFFHVDFMNLDTHPEQLQWLTFLRDMQQALFQWVGRHRRDHPALADIGYRHRHRQQCRDHSGWLQWLDVLEHTGAHTRRYRFSDEPEDVSSPQNDTSDSSHPSHPSLARWKISTPLTSRIHCYDTTATRVPLDTFVNPRGFHPQYIRMMVQFTHVWVNEQSCTAGLGLNVLQLQQGEVEPMGRFAFVDGGTGCRRVHTVDAETQTEVTGEVTTTASVTHSSSSSPSSASSASSSARSSSYSSSSSSTSSRCDHPVYGKYFKMCAKGVPKPAVQQKMRMNGMDPAVLDTPDGEPLPESDTNSQDDQLILSLQDTQQLRKTEINANRPKAVSGGAGHGLSLTDIVSGLQSLRKTIFGQSIKTTTEKESGGGTGDGVGGRKSGDQCGKRGESRTGGELVVSGKPSSSSFLQLLSAKYQSSS